METQPFVTAVCVTGLSPERVKRFLPLTIRCFENQTYPNRELLIVADGCAELLPPTQGNVRVVWVSSKKSLGELRNIGLEEAHGSLIIQWDEDWHHPERMAVQVTEQQRQPTLPLILARQLAYCLDHDVAFEREIRIAQEGMNYVNAGIHGSIIHPRDDSKRYPSIPLTEDTEFLRLWGKCVMLDNHPSLYVRFCHEGTVSGREQVMREATTWRDGTWGIDHRVSLPVLEQALGALCTPSRPYFTEVAEGKTLPPDHEVPELVVG